MIRKIPWIIGIWAVACTTFGGEFSYNGLIRSEFALSTTGERTQPADAGTAFDNDGRTWNLFALRLELDAQYIVDRHLSFTGRFRGWGDWVNKIDDAYDDNIDLFAGDEFPGNGWLLSTTDSNNTVVDIPELYLDWTVDNLWLRVGRQQIAWGDAIGMRILDDMISSLDLRRHGGNYDLGTEEFRDERIGQTGARANWRIPGTDWELEGSVTDFLPTLLYPAGSPYANFPGSVRILNDEGVSDARNSPVYGVRVKGLVLDGQGEVTLAYTRRPQSAGVFSFDTQRDLGTLLTTGELPLRVQYPRINSLGGAFSYSMSADPVGPLSFFDGLIARVEAAYFIDKQFTNSAPATVVAPAGVLAPPAVGPVPLPAPVPFAGDIIQEDELSVGIVLEKIHKFRPDWLATIMLFQWWHRTAADLTETHRSLVGDDDWNWLLFSITQNFKRNEFAFTLNTSYDTSGGWFVQPALKWRPSHKYQFDVFFNWFDGGTKDVYGPLKPNKEIAFRIGRYF